MEGGKEGGGVEGGRIVLADLDVVLWEGVEKVLKGEESVIEVEACDESGRHVFIVSSCWVPVAEEHIVKPIRHHALCISQVTYGLQHCLRV